MSNLCTIIEFIQKLCLENTVINNMLIKIDEINQEDSKLANQIEEFDREYIRLQIELHNLETINSHNNISLMEAFQQTSINMYKDSVELRTIMKEIDFTKILQCYHMEMEIKCRKEWQPIQECIVKTLSWHERMEQRHIVQKYRQSNKVCQDADEANKILQESMKESFRQSFELIKQAKLKRNELILVLIKMSKDMLDFKAKMGKLDEYQIYIEGLRHENTKFKNQLEKTNLKAFHPTLKLNSNQNSVSNLKSNYETRNFIVPKLPTFTDILKGFNQTSVSVVENTTEFGLKSILQNSNCKQSIITKHTKNVRFKVQLEEYQEMTQNIYSSEIESDIDAEIEILPTQIAIGMEDNECQERKENLQEIKDLEHNTQIEIVDVSTPGNDLIETVEKIQEVTDSTDYNLNSKNQDNKKPLIEIQQCIVFKEPFPIQELSNMQNKENISTAISTTSGYKNSSDTQIKDILNTTKNSFYEEFLNISSVEESPTTSDQININNTSTLNELGTLFTNTKDCIFITKESNGANNSETNKSVTSEVQDVLDFGCARRFTFDSDDNMTDNYNAGNMDFM